MTDTACANVNAIRDAWAPFAARLAAWTMERLVNRTDVWGGYNDLDERETITSSGSKLGPTTTRPAKRLRGQVYLDLGVLEAHYRAERPSQVVGLHTTSP